MTSDVDIQELQTVITSSPCPIFIARKLRSKASVPLFNPIAHVLPQYFANDFSKFLTSFPKM